MRVLFSVLLCLIVLFGISCIYEEPLVEEDVIEINEEVLGSWKSVEEDVSVVVLKFSETEYVIEYWDEKNSLYFRGYEIEVGGVKCVQIQLIGSDKEAARGKERRYHVVKYELEGDKLEIRLLNDDVVDKKIHDSEKLMKVFVENVNNEKLFGEPFVFEKIAKE